MITNRFPIVRCVAAAGLAAALMLAVPTASAQDENKQTHQVSEKVSEALQKLKPLQDAKNFAGMQALIDGQLKGVNPTSYDAAYLLDMKARLYIAQEQYTKAIEPWEEALKLSDEHNYFEPRNAQDITKYLAQLIFSEATSTKDKDLQKREVAKSAGYLKRYLEKATTPEPETQMLYAQILFYQASPESQHPDQALLSEARQIVEHGLQSAVHPKEGFYMLLLAIMQAQNDYVHSAEIMELVLKNNPQKKDMWPMLFGTYYNLASTAKEGSPEQRDYYVRAINTIERAQALGFMATPRDNYNLVTLYIAAGQFGKACDLLYDGMKAGKIESTINNWRILGAYYQQANKELQAISALQEATKLFPKEGSLDVAIGQLYTGMDRTKEAHDYYAQAVAKGNTGEKPHLAYLYLAYSSFELGRYDEALQEINKAASFPDGAKDTQVKNVKEGIEGSIADAKNRAAAAAAAAKKL